MPLQERLVEKVLEIYDGDPLFFQYMVNGLYEMHKILGEYLTKEEIIEQLDTLYGIVRVHDKKIDVRYDPDVPSSKIESLWVKHNWNPEKMFDIFSELLIKYPFSQAHIVENDIKNQLLYRLIGDTVESLGPDDPHLILTYLVSAYPIFKNEKAEDILQILNTIIASKPHRKRSRSKSGELESGSKRSKKSKSSKRKKKETIGEVDIIKAMDYFGYDFGAGYRDKMINYFDQKYPHLGRANIKAQLQPYDFNDRVTTTPYGSPYKKLVRTPPGGLYSPSTFSPSTHGACSKELMSWLADERTSRMPGYKTPPKSSGTLKRRRLTFSDCDTSR